VVHCFKGDLLNANDIEQSLKAAGKIDVVINLAAVVPVDLVNSVPAKAYAVNVLGAINLLEGLARCGQRPYVFQCSTAHVYASSVAAIAETDRLDPISIYGRTKLFAEYAMADICKAYGMVFGVGRLFSIHDAGQKGSFLRPNIERRLAEEDLTQVFHLYGADSVRDFLTAESAAHLIAQLALAHFEGTVNVASGQPTRIRDFVQSLTPTKLDILHQGKSDSLVADISKLNVFLKLQSEN
jgi:nucleoside-diphosphate-sugar epimerase